uniref:Olfactory receptor n=1 Tax=Pyxicephalus adspersus TaxID=30357 RepID=A0AAV3AZM2_PYXAD|nr:TPA: hypothetical protein GDO54_006214 [Pyxicephalus adspersus]
MAPVNIDYENKSKTTEFVIIGFSDYPDLKIPLLLCFLCVYTFTLAGNLVLTILISWSPSLSTPMYFFLCNLSSLDVLYTSTTCPKLIGISITQGGRISYVECMIQLYFFMAFASTEYFLLTVMSFDRYVAICKPLHYTLIMSKQVCLYGAMGSWLGGLAASIPIATVISTLDFCNSNTINHFFCDITALINLACSNTMLIRTVILIQGTSKGKYKTFSTCASHLTTVSFFYITVLVLYMNPTSALSLGQGKILTTLYVYVIPMLNPVVYSFRNRNVKMALKQFMMEINNF